MHYTDQCKPQSGNAIRQDVQWFRFSGSRFVADGLQHPSSRRSMIPRTAPRSATQFLARSNYSQMRWVLLVTKNYQCSCLQQFPAKIKSNLLDMASVLSFHYQQRVIVIHFPPTRVLYARCPKSHADTSLKVNILLVWKGNFIFLWMNSVFSITARLLLNVAFDPWNCFPQVVMLRHLEKSATYFSVKLVITLKKTDLKLNVMNE